MIVSCEICGKEYNVRDEKLKKAKYELKCKGCGHINLLTPPESAQVDDRYDNASDSLSTPQKAIRFGLIFKVVSLMLVVSLVPLITFWWISFSQSNARTREDTELLLDQIDQGLTEHVDEWIDKNVRGLSALADMDDIQSMEQEKQVPLLKALNKAYPWTYLVFTTDTYGANVARNDGKALRNYSDRSYIRQVLSGQPFGWQTLIGKTSKKPALVLSVPIKQNGRVVGVLASAMAIDDISGRVAAWHRGQTGYAFLVDETDKVVAHQKMEYTLAQKNLSQHPLVSSLRRGTTGVQYFKDEAGESYIGPIRPAKYGWGMAIQQREGEVFKALAQAQRLAYIMLFATVVVVSVVAYLLGRAIVVPIRNLTDVTERISKGELDATIEVHTKDEIAALGHAIERLQDSVRLSIERFSRRKRSRERN